MTTLAWMSKNECVDCGVAREALSARLDGEREAVPSHRVDEHLEACVSCAGWYRDASRQAVLLRTLASEAVPKTMDARENVAENLQPVGGRRRWTVPFVARCGLAVVGVLQLGLACAQLLGVDFGVVGNHHGAANGMHLLHESTAWSAALGGALIAAAIRPVLAAGVACVAACYALGLVYFVAADALTGHVTPGRATSHLPVVAGAVLAFTVWRSTPTSAPEPRSHRAVETNEESTDALSQRRRSKDLRASDDSAA
ncbi:zf-HC2 domain-containing protein [Mycolicibacterium neoaurum]|uniref:zf-HC2 domain-containing protein n=2 Tax=Mycolicibacterium neoaurum TaxID=1795 RepID=UPI00248CAF4A|nr:zf-HC2 domain-containing protein [Mycolicibacterium neoaurum]WBS06312.1 zf-HC2 domain-containing protein [Mycolicibacterium neoaurum]